MTQMNKICNSTTTIRGRYKCERQRTHGREPRDEPWQDRPSRTHQSQIRPSLLCCNLKFALFQPPPLRRPPPCLRLLSAPLSFPITRRFISLGLSAKTATYSSHSFSTSGRGLKRAEPPLIKFTFSREACVSVAPISTFNTHPIHHPSSTIHINLRLSIPPPSAIPVATRISFSGNIHNKYSSTSSTTGILKGTQAT
jgi:hypothetical protein